MFKKKGSSIAPPAPPAAPWVCVYLPTSNRAALLARAADSVLAQSHPAIELVVALDRPDPATREFALALPSRAREGRRIRIVESGGAGAPAARNAALAAATSSLVTGLDDDDYLQPDHVEKLAAAFDPERHAFAFTGFRLLFRERSGARREVAVSPPVRDAGLEDLLRKNVVGNQVLTLAARVREVGGFDESLPAWQDHDLWLRLARRFGRGIAVAGHTYVCDQVSASGRISSDPQRIDAALDRFLAKHAEYADPRLAACLELSRARYGARRLTLRQVALVARAAGVSRLLAEAVLIYAGLMRPRC